MRILFAGGDVRMIYAAKELSEKCEVCAYGLGETPFRAPSGYFDAVILPLPLSKDGKTVFAPLSDVPVSFEGITRFADAKTLVLAGGGNALLSAACEEAGCALFNYFSAETLTLRNAALTAEAAAALFIINSENALLGASVLISGSGRIAFFLAERMRAFGCAVTFAARNGEKRALARLNGFRALIVDEARAHIAGYDYIANTVPAPLFAENDFAAMKKTTVFEELATLPAEHTRLAAAYAERFGITYISAGGLPGKYSPAAAGRFIAEEIESIILQQKE